MGPGVPGGLGRRRLVRRRGPGVRRGQRLRRQRLRAVHGRRPDPLGRGRRGHRGRRRGYSRVALACFNRLGAVDPERCRPFAADRRGTVFGEGAAVLVLEAAGHARRRGAPGLRPAGGRGLELRRPPPDRARAQREQIERAMREALREAGAAADDLGVVVPHGTGTDLNDVVESQILGAVLGGEVRAARADDPLTAPVTAASLTTRCTA
ncbi:beta-ketoacyl synthase N-terminal-like domain-containing protein [Streptomyces sp. M19]